MSDEQLKADIKSVTLCVFRAFDEEAEAALRRLRTRLERVPDEDAVTEAVQQEVTGWATYLSDFEARQKALAAAREALTKLREHDGGTRYNGDDDEVGELACCRVASWKPHDSDCPHAVAVAEFDNLLAALDALDAARGEAVAAVPDGGFAIVPADALREVIRISDRSHPAWDAVKAAMLAAANKENTND